MSPTRLCTAVSAFCVLLASLTPRSAAVDAEGVTENKSAAQSLKPYDRKPDTAPLDSPAAAQKGFRRARIPAGFSASLWAAEPLLANPVAFSFDGKGRMYIAETHRYRTSVLDIRHYMFMLEDDLANRNQADWERSIKKNFPKDWQDLGKESEVVRFVEDTNNDGVADKSHVYADGFNSILDGIASGVLARPDGVWLANIPGLYKLGGQDTNGKAATKEELFRGFGIRFNYTGHDLHGLIKGMDGRIYFSIGDRGTSVKTKEGTMLEVPDEGAIFRCEEDGSHLELVMRGLRNPQELAFDDYGNLFTCDNDSDQGDRERFVYVVEGGDAGWRIGYQHCPQPAERNPWLAEHMWEPRDPGKNQPAYILSPLANLPDGPGGFVHYPGTGLPDKYKGCFFLACYKGSSLTSQVAVLKPVPDGASFKLETLETFIPGCQATDVDFGPDSRLYVSFWDEGWERSAQGRIMKVEHEEARKEQAAVVGSVQELLAGGVKNLNSILLRRLLSHQDQRVRLEAQWELAGRDNADRELESLAMGGGLPRLPRIHAIWALGQAVRRSGRHIELIHRLDTWIGGTTEPDDEVRSQWARLMGESLEQLSSPPDFLPPSLLKLLADSSPRVRLFAAQAMGKCGRAEAVAPLLELARREQDKSQEMRHVISWALAQISLRSEPAWKAVRSHSSDTGLAVRMTVLQAAAHVARNPKDWCQDAANVVAGFLKYDQLLPEASRLIHDRGLEPAGTGTFVDEKAGQPPVVVQNASPVLGLYAAESTDPMTMLRGLNGYLRAGGQSGADKLVMSLMNPEHPVPPALAVEALKMLAEWPSPSPRDRVSGNYRPGKGVHERGHALSALLTLTRDVIVSDPSVTEQTLLTIRALKAGAWSSFVTEVAGGKSFAPKLRVLALHVLSDLQSPKIGEALSKAIADPVSSVRIAAAGLLGKTDPVAAAKGLEAALAQGMPEDIRAAFSELASLTGAEADRILAEQLLLLAAGKVPVLARLELLEAASRHSAPVVKEALAKYEASLPKDDVVTKFAVCLEGGDIANGKRLFKEHPVAACTRCHMVQKAGGEAGPPLDGIASRKDRRYILESILLPNAQIAESFRMVVCSMKDGSTRTGVLKSETADSITIQAPGEEEQTIKKGEIATRDAVPSAMMPGMDVLLTKREIRDLVEYVASLKDQN